MSWILVDSDKPTQKQLKYAEVLLEQLYGDITEPIHKMTKRELSQLIDETKKN